jgi:hypothetical protein
MSARTRAWEKAEALATTELAARDPVLRRLREIEDQEAAKRAAEAAKLAARATISQALLDWDNETHQAHTPGSASVLRTFIRNVERWAVEEGFRYLDEITRSPLGQWKAQWSEAAPRKDDRMGTQTQASFQGRCHRRMHGENACGTGVFPLSRTKIRARSIFVYRV